MKQNGYVRRNKSKVGICPFWQGKVRYGFLDQNIDSVIGDAGLGKSTRIASRQAVNYLSAEEGVAGLLLLAGRK
jgi:hypothetical protein